MNYREWMENICSANKRRFTGKGTFLRILKIIHLKLIEASDPHNKQEFFNLDKNVF